MTYYFFPCGCGGSRDMQCFGGQIRDIHHCPTHAHLWSADKTLNQMVEEVRSLQLDGDGRDGAGPAVLSGPDEF